MTEVTSECSIGLKRDAATPLELSRDKTLGEKPLSSRKQRSKTKYTITYLRDTVKRCEKLINGTLSRVPTPFQKKKLRTEIEALRNFADAFPKHYLKKIDAIDQPQYLRDLCTNARTIIDVGVNKGTPNLYEAFPHLPFVLIDPTRKGEKTLTSRPHEYTYVNKAIGDNHETQILKAHSGKSTLLTPAGEFDNWKIHREYEVTVDRLDTILEDVNAKGPYGVKLDIQGYELKAIRGMTRIFPQIDFLICETNIRNTAVGAYQFSELVAELLKHDFVFFNFLNNFKPNARFYDVVFLPRSSKKFDMLD